MLIILLSISLVLSFKLPISVTNAVLSNGFFSTKSSIVLIFFSIWSSFNFKEGNSISSLDKKHSLLFTISCLISVTIFLNSSLLSKFFFISCFNDVIVLLISFNSTLFLLNLFKFISDSSLFLLILLFIVLLKSLHTFFISSILVTSKFLFFILLNNVSNTVTLFDNLDISVSILLFKFFSITILSSLKLLIFLFEFKSLISFSNFSNLLFKDNNSSKFTFSILACNLFILSNKSLLSLLLSLLLLLLLLLLLSISILLKSTSSAICLDNDNIFSSNVSSISLIFISCIFNN